MRFIGMITASGLLLNSCVTTHSGKIANAEKFSMSCAPNDAVEAEHFILVSCAIENTSDEWLTYQIKEIHLKDQGVKVSNTQETSDFAEAYRFTKAKNDHNTGMLLSGLVIVGTGMIAGGLSGSSSSSSTTAGVGAAVVAGSTGALIGRGVRGEYMKNQYGSEHLLVDSFRIPPKLFVRKYFLLERSNANLSNFNFDVCFTSPEKKCLAMTQYTNFEKSTLNSRL